MKKSVLFAIAGTVAMVSWSPLGAAAAGGVSAMSNTRTSDPAGDVPYCKGDLVSAVADWTNDVLRFQFETACGMDTNADPSWTAGATGLGVAIDVDGDNEGDLFAVYNRVDRGVLYDASDAVACKGTASHPTGTSYVIELGTGCVPGPFT